MESLKILCAELSMVILFLDYDQEHCNIDNFKILISIGASL